MIPTLHPTVLEKFTRCSMDPNVNSFVGVKVGYREWGIRIKK